MPAAPIMKFCSHALLFCLISSAVALPFCYNLQFDKLVLAILDSLRSLNPSSSGLTSFFNQRLATICFHFYWYSIARVYCNTPHAFSAKGIPCSTPAFFRSVINRLIVIIDPLILFQIYQGYPRSSPRPNYHDMEHIL